MMRVAVVAGIVMLAACGDGEAPRASPDVAPAAASEQPQPVPRPATSVQTDDPCPSTGRWALCSVEKRLERSGFVLSRIGNDSPERAGFSVRPAVYKLGRGRLEIFLYDDEAVLAKDLAAMDTVAVAPRGGAGAWPSAPAIVRSGNLAAVFMDQNARQAERLVLAITAGAPAGR